MMPDPKFYLGGYQDYLDYATKQKPSETLNPDKYYTTNQKDDKGVSYERPGKSKRKITQEEIDFLTNIILPIILRSGRGAGPGGPPPRPTPVPTPTAPIRPNTVEEDYTKIMSS